MRVIQITSGNANPLKARLVNHAELRQFAKEADLVLYQKYSEPWVQEIETSVAPSRFPQLSFSGIHPDLVHIQQNGKNVRGPIGHLWHSSLALYGFIHDIPVEACVRLFCAETYERLNFYDIWTASQRLLLNELAEAGIPTHYFYTWCRLGCFMYDPNHPVRLALDLAGKFASRLGESRRGSEVTALFALFPHHGPIFPLYPEAAERLGTSGSYLFSRWPDPGKPIDLRSFIAMSYNYYGEINVKQFNFPPLVTQRFKMMQSIHRLASS